MCTYKGGIYSRTTMNETTATIARNTKAMMGSQVITWISSFILMSFMPRYLGAEEWGRLYFAMSLNGITGLLIDLGLTTLIVKDVARDKEKVSSLVINGLALRSLAWTFSLVATMAFVVLAGYPAQTVQVVFILALANWFYGNYDLFHRVFIGLERMEYRSICLVIEKVFLAVFGVAALVLGMGPVAVAVVMLLSMVANFGMSWYFLRKTVKLHFEITTAIWKPLLINGFPFLISSTFAFIYYRINVMMMSSMTNDAVVGWYGAPYRLFDTLMFFPLILTTAVFPVLARLGHTSKTNMTQTSRQLLDLTLIVAVPLAVGMASLSQPIISVLFGLKEFWNSVVLLQILAISVLLIYVDFVLNTVLVANDKQKQLSVVAMIATIISIGINYVAIKYTQETWGNGAMGAAFSTGVTEVCVMAMSIFLLPKGVFGKSNLVLAGKTLLGGAAMWGVVWLVQREVPYGQGWILAGGLGCVVYTAMLFFLKVVSKREVNFLINLLPMRKRFAASLPND